MPTLVQLDPPSGEPVSLADAKLALRFSGTALDSDIERRITSARQVADWCNSQPYPGFSCGFFVSN